MADYELVKYFRDNSAMVSQMDAKRLSRADLGTLGMPQVVEQLAELSRQFEVFTPYAESAGNALLREAKNRYQTYLQLIIQIGSMPVGEFSNGRLNLETRLDEEWGRVMEIWPQLAVIALDKRGYLSDPSTLRAELEVAAKRQLDELKKVGNDIIDRAQLQAKVIEDTARSDVRSFSVTRAQEQFDDANRPFLHKAYWWGGGSAALFVLFFLTAHHMFWAPPPALAAATASARNPALAIYLLGIRLAILTVMGGLLTFGLRIFRAHLHMYELNNHRRRVANSMQAFVESAHSPEQRDYIFSRLVDAVVNFGDSGLLTKDGDGAIGVPAVAIDAITKNLGK